MGYGKEIHQYNKPLHKYTTAELTKELALRKGAKAYRTYNTWSVKANGKHITGHDKATIVVVRHNQ